jgi:hypothetical protein
MNVDDEVGASPNLAHKRPWEPSPLATLPTLLISLASGEVFSFDLFVDENWRGRRIFAALGSRSASVLQGARLHDSLFTSGCVQSQFPEGDASRRL